jgi:hypothetical protein
MNRGAGLLGIGVVLTVIGAILEFGVTATARGFNVNTIGMILLIIGIVAFVVGLILSFTGTARTSTVREEYRDTPNGREHLVRERDNLAP